MFLKGAIRLKKGETRFLKTAHPWVYSNELVKIDKSLPPGSWVTLEAPDGRVVAHGMFNPRSLIAFRAFERASFSSGERVRELFGERLDRALRLRRRAYADRIGAGDMGPASFRLCFGESDGLPGFILDLYEASSGAGIAVAQCHAAGADTFLAWAKAWLEKSLGIRDGVVRNDIDVRRREGAELMTEVWGQLPSDVFALEGGVKFFIDPKAGQKTGYFYDHRDSRAELSRRAAQIDGAILDCFSYVGGWGLQALKRGSKSRLVAVDVSAVALGALRRNAKEAGLADRVETIEADLFQDAALDKVSRQAFEVVISDPPSLTSSAKQEAEGRRAHEACFTKALKLLARDGLAALASCSFHLSWEDFLVVVSRSGVGAGRELRMTHIGSQGADHPVLAAMPETRYLKSVIVEGLGR